MSTQRSKRGSRTDLAEYYRGLLDEQAQSDLSIAEFAEDVGVSAATLYSWRRRLASSAGSREGELVEVEIVGDGRVLQRGAAIVLTVDGRVRIDLETDFDDSALERVLAVLSRC